MQTIRERIQEAVGDHNRVVEELITDIVVQFTDWTHDCMYQPEGVGYWRYRGDNDYHPVISTEDLFFNFKQEKEIL